VNPPRGAEWALLGSFGSISAQPVRARRASLRLASALIALSGIGLAWILSAVALSIGVARRMRGQHDV
jgi:hypothetical protein